MTAMDGDGIDEELTRAVSVAMLAAARAGEQLARINQAAAQERQARTAGQTEQAGSLCGPAVGMAAAGDDAAAQAEAHNQAAACRSGEPWI